MWALIELTLSLTILLIWLVCKIIWWSLKLALWLLKKIGVALAAILMLPGTRFSGDVGAEAQQEKQYQQKRKTAQKRSFASKEDCFKVLGVSVNDDLATIKKAYRKLSKIYHPDVNPSDDATEQMKQINLAWSQVQYLKGHG